jgi:hypothetical protein
MAISKLYLNATPIYLAASFADVDLGHFLSFKISRVGSTNRWIVSSRVVKTYKASKI